MYLSLKRLSDIVLSLTALLILFPFFLLVWIIIKLESPSSPSIYKGIRASKGSGTFKLFKFRTMVVNAESLGGFSTAINDPRFTSLGRFLRKYKIDEIPQLFNVIRGDMSLVGPRPQVTYYTDKYNQDEIIILSVRPGITDLASILYIDMDKTLGDQDVDLKYETEIEPGKNLLRIAYVKRISLRTDVIILMLTFFRLIGFKGNTIKKIIELLIPDLKFNS
jgi:lipopolysaccharide/colanic/teichoic acid biosynthesis glycosyltransferase